MRMCHHQIFIGQFGLFSKKTLSTNIEFDLFITSCFETRCSDAILDIRDSFLIRLPRHLRESQMICSRLCDFWDGYLGIITSMFRNCIASRSC